MTQVSASEIDADGGRQLGVGGEGIYNPATRLVLVARLLTSLDQQRRAPRPAIQPRSIAGDRPVAAKFLPKAPVPEIVVKPQRGFNPASQREPRQYMQLKSSELTPQLADAPMPGRIDPDQSKQNDFAPLLEPLPPTTVLIPVSKFQCLAP